MNTKFKIDPTPIADIIFNKNLLIPVYQRAYTWKAEHVNALIDDLIERAKDNSEHYFGVIALSKETVSDKGKDVVISKVIDGQQRLTTSLILLKYLVDHADEVDQDSTALIAGGGGINFQHELGGTLKENITNLINGNVTKLKGVFADNNKVIAERLNGYPKSFINNLYKVFREKFIVATLDYTIDRNEEMLVFENLNSKGSPLKAFDLIRNHIISLTKSNTPKENLKTFNARIKNLTETIYKSGLPASEDKREQKLERFIEFYTIFEKAKKGIKNGKYTNYPVYKNFKDLFDGYLSEEQFAKRIEHMRKFAILYLDLVTGRGVGENVWINALSNKDNHYPYVFLLMDKFGTFDLEENWTLPEDAIDYIKYPAIHVIKTMTVMGTGQSFTNMWNDIIKNVHAGVTPAQLHKMLEAGDIVGTQATPSNKEFSTSLEFAPKQKWIPATLIDILEFRANRINEANEFIKYQYKSLEHIMPQKPKVTDWPFVENNEDEHKHTVNQIGNLANFDKSKNSKLGNRKFLKKLEVYKESNSPLITGKDLNIDDLRAQSVFTFETIRNRTKKLAKDLLDEFK